MEEQKKVLSPYDRDCREAWYGFGDQLMESLNNQGTCHNDTRHARRILETMEDFDIEGTLEKLALHGGYCDCEILFNVVLR